MKTKNFVDYRLAKTKQEVLSAFDSGLEIWQEISDEYPECTGWDSKEEIEKELFEDVEEDEDISSYGIHLVGDETDFITGLFFDLSKQGKTFEEIQKATGIKKVEEDESQTVITIHYPSGEIISHWV